MNLIPYPQWTPSQYMEYFNTAMKDALSHGLTSIHDAFTSPDQVEFFKKQVIYE
jgi:predicted amidohydrolase YtcJ